MRKPTIGLLCILLALAANGGEQILTRAELFAPITNTIYSQEREYAELDLNNDRTNDLVLSESLSWVGTGGWVYHLYRGVGEDRFIHLNEFGANNMAIERDQDTGIVRLWRYQHSSGRSGHIQYFDFNSKGIFQESGVFELVFEVGNPNIGEAIWNAIFTEKRKLKLKKWGASNKQIQSIAGKPGSD